MLRGMVIIVMAHNMTRDGRRPARLICSDKKDSIDTAMCLLIPGADLLHVNLQAVLLWQPKD